MKIGVADYGLNVWDGALLDIEERLEALRAIGYEGTEGLTAPSAAEAVQRAALYRRVNMDFADCAGPDYQTMVQWTAALGKSYVWTWAGAGTLEGLARQVARQAAICKRWRLRAVLHNHMGTPVETYEQVEAFLAACPDAALLLDTAHLAAAGGDPVKLVRRYYDRIAAVHLKDWLETDASAKEWTRRGRFCELGAGNIGLDNAAVANALAEVGYDGWLFVEHDDHLQDPMKDLAVSRDYLRKAGL